MLKKITNNKLLLAFLLSLLLGIFIVLPCLVSGRGIYSLTADYNQQQIPFNMNINQSLKEGSILWTWYNELGSNFIGTYSFYNLFSPFNILGYLFPAKWFPYLGGILLILKYAVAGLTSYLFLKRYVKNKNYAVIGSLLYAFSGFQLTNILFFHFHDVVALFPLLLYSLDKLMYEDENRIFAFVVALLAFTNWFFFIGEVIFLIIYFVVKIIAKEYKFSTRKFKIILFEGIIGILISSLVLLPTFLFIISNPRIGSSWDLKNIFRYPNFGYYLELFRSVLFVPQTMANRAFITDCNYYSVELYLPLVGFIFVIAYVIKNYKSWDSILLIVSAIFMAIPILNSIFFLFNTTYYARWFFMPILIMVLVSIKYLDSKDIIGKRAFVINLILYVVFVLGIFIYINRSSGTNIIFDKNYFYSMVLVTLFNFISTFFISRISNKKRIVCLTIGIFISVTLWGNYMTYIYRGKNIKADLDYMNYLDVNKYIDIDSNSRTNSSKSCPSNLGVIGRFNNIKSFNSNISGSTFEFYNSLSIKREVSTLIDVNDKDLNNFLGIKNIIVCGNDIVDNSYTLVSDSYPYRLYYNSTAKEIGFVTNGFMLKDEFSKLDYKNKVRTLNEKIILTSNQARKYKDLFNEEVNITINDVNFSKNSFSAIIDSNREALVSFTIPYDKGFRATVNGKDTLIENVNNGFIAIKVSSGENNINFSYTPPGLKIGLYFSLMGIIIYIVYIVVSFKKEKFL